MNRKDVLTASAVLFLAVALGAFGAHGIKERVGPEALGQWRTAVEYQFYHGLALLLLSLLKDRLAPARARAIRTMFVSGIFLFSGSIYLLATRDLLGIQEYTYMVGPVTPLGGLFFMAGWATLFITVFRAGNERWPRLP